MTKIKNKFLPKKYLKKIIPEKFFNKEKKRIWMEL